MDIDLQVALIAAITSIITTILSLWIKSLIDKWRFKFEIQEKHKHKHEQQKKIKESIASNKIQLINSAEELNHRLWNFANNYSERWHKVNGNFADPTKYYFCSFVYRLGAFLWWAKKVDDDLEYFDTTIADESDLYYVKYVRFFNLIMCQTTLFNDLDYDDEYATDHFFKHDLETEVEMWNHNGFLTYSDFVNRLETITPKIRNLCQFIDGASPNENRLRWLRFYALHLTLICFLNIYGYDFQYTDEEQAKKIIKTMKQHEDGEKGLQNFKRMLEKLQLHEEDETQKILELI